MLAQPSIAVVAPPSPLPTPPSEVGYSSIKAAISSSEIPEPRPSIKPDRARGRRRMHSQKNTLEPSVSASSQSTSTSTSAPSSSSSSPPPAFTIRAATLQDASAIAHLGAAVFSAAFGFSIPAADLETYLKDAYSVSAIEEDIRSSSKHLIVACTSRPNTADSDVNSDSDSDSDWDWPTDSNSHSNSNSRSETYTEQVIGFAQLTEGTTEPCIEDLEGLVELQRLYVDADFHGLGVGKALTNKAEGLARDLAYRIMWLGVWEGNFRAQRVYESMSFSRAGEHEFKMGRCIQTDWIMIKDL